MSDISSIIQVISSQLLVYVSNNITKSVKHQVTIVIISSYHPILQLLGLCFVPAHKGRPS